MTKIEAKLKEIADSISEYMLNPESKKEAGLYTGTVGLLMFMTYYSRYSGEKKYLKIADELLEDCCESICNGIYYASFCGGLSGMLYGLNHLNQIGFIDVDLTEVHEGYSKLLRSSLKTYAEEGRFDFMHQATGIALYLLQNGDPVDLTDVAEYVKTLDRTAEHKDDTVKWLTDVNSGRDKVYNIALSHGMSSIAIFLSICYEKNIETQISRRLLEGVVNYVLQQELDPLKEGSFFPYCSIESNRDNVFKSRMAWCYGDLGVATALWRAGIALGNDTWKAKAFEVMEFAIDRRDLGSNRVVDACICHGTAGIAQIFRRMYYNTGDEKFSETAKFWTDETLKMAKYEDGETAGFKSFTGASNQWVGTYDFLEGIAGIGLALIASQGDEQYSAWDKILLLS